MDQNLTRALVEHLWDEANASLFASAVLYPNQHLIRVAERVSYVDQTTLRRTIDFEISLATHGKSSSDSRQSTSDEPQSAENLESSQATKKGGAPSMRVFPLLGFAKDRLLNDEPVIDAAGTKVQLLNRFQSQHIHEYAIKLLVMAALREWVAEQDSQQREAAARTIAWRLATIPYQAPSVALSTYAKVFDAPNGDRGDADASGASLAPEESTTLDLAYTHIRANHELRDLCHRLTTHEFMLVACQAESSRWLTLRVSYDSLHAQRERLKTWGGRLRHTMGQLPHSYRIHIPLALRAQSYHIRMNGPPDHYVWEQSLRTTPRPPTADDTALGVSHQLDLLRPPTSPEVVLGKPARPTREAHLYVGGFSTRTADRLYARFVFFERLPGMQGIAILLSVALLALLVAFLFSLAELSKDGNLSAGVSSIVLLAPGVAAALVLPSMADSRVSQGPLAARMVLVGTTFMAFASAVLLVTLAAQVGPSGEFPFAGTFIWMILIVLQGCASGLAIWRYWRALHGYGLAVALEAGRSPILDDRIDIYSANEYNWLVKNRRIPKND